MNEIFPCIGGPANGQWVALVLEVGQQLSGTRVLCGATGFYTLHIAEEYKDPRCFPVTDGRPYWFLVHDSAEAHFNFNDVLAAFGHPRPAQYVPSPRFWPNNKEW